MWGDGGCSGPYRNPSTRCRSLPSTRCRSLRVAGSLRFVVSRTIKSLIYVGAALCVVAGVAMLLVVQWISPRNKESMWETPVTPEFMSSMRTAGFPISVSRVVSASSYGGWHGDGAELTAYRYPPSESEALIVALKQRHPEFSWIETRSEFVVRHSPWKLLPRELLPESDSSTLLVGHASEGSPMEEYIVDRSRGTLYSVSNRF